MGLRYIIIFLLLIQSAAAATISGTIYDLEFDVVGDVLLDISTTPKQQMVAQAGTYTFEVPPGNYVLRARQVRDGRVLLSSTDQITVPDEGIYIVDLILFPELEDDVFNESFGELDLEGLDIEEKSLVTPALIVLLLVLIGWIGAFLLLRKKKAAPPDTFAKRIVDFIDKQGGRATQKDIRKAFPYSEAKISLIIAELQAKGKVEKIRKGRANIIVLK